MMGFLYWIERGKTGGGILPRLIALAHGLLMCWTRIVGVAVAFYPIVREGFIPRFSQGMDLGLN